MFCRQALVVHRMHAILIQTPRCTLTYNLMHLHRPLLQLIEDNSCKHSNCFASPSSTVSMGTTAHAVTASLQ
jgi:hypothetical protein